MMSRPSNPFLLFSAIIAITLLAAGLWPFRFFQKNNVQWIPGRDGLEFQRYGIVYGKTPFFVPGGAIDLAKSFAIVMQVRPQVEPSDYLPRILSAFDADGREIFFLAQWRSGLVLRILERERFQRLNYRETGAGGLQKGVPHTVVIRSEADSGLTVYVDGHPARTRAGAKFTLLSRFRVPARLVLGNSPAGDSPWTGTIYSLSVFSSALTPGEIDASAASPVVRYRFSEGSGSVCHGTNDTPAFDLFMPAVFRAPAKRILAPPWQVQNFNRSFWKDVFLNILGFVPFGFVAFAWIRDGGKRRTLTVTIVAVVLGGAISLIIELLQVYLPTRDSSMTDLLNNAFGTYLGTRLFRATSRPLSW